MEASRHRLALKGLKHQGRRNLADLTMINKKIHLDMMTLANRLSRGPLEKKQKSRNRFREERKTWTSRIYHRRQAMTSWHLAGRESRSKTVHQIPTPSLNLRSSRMNPRRKFTSLARTKKAASLEAGATSASHTSTGINTETSRTTAHSSKSTSRTWEDSASKIWRKPRTKKKRWNLTMI